MTNKFEFDLTLHAEKVISERNINLEWIDRILEYPDTVEIDKNDPTILHHLGKIAENENRILRVVYRNELNSNKIITVYFDRTKRKIK